MRSPIKSKTSAPSMHFPHILTFFRRFHFQIPVLCPVFRLKDILETWFLEFFQKTDWNPKINPFSKTWQRSNGFTYITFWLKITIKGVFLDGIATFELIWEWTRVQHLCFCNIWLATRAPATQKNILKSLLHDFLKN